MPNGLCPEIKSSTFTTPSENVESLARFLHAKYSINNFRTEKTIKSSFADFRTFLLLTGNPRHLQLFSDLYLFKNTQIDSGLGDLAIQEDDFTSVNERRAKLMIETITALYEACGISYALEFLTDSFQEIKLELSYIDGELNALVFDGTIQSSFSLTTINKPSFSKLLSIFSQKEWVLEKADDSLMLSFSGKKGNRAEIKINNKSLKAYIQDSRAVGLSTPQDCSDLYCDDIESNKKIDEKVVSIGDFCKFAGINEKIVEHFKSEKKQKTKNEIADLRIQFIDILKRLFTDVCNKEIDESHVRDIIEYLLNEVFPQFDKATWSRDFGPLHAVLLERIRDDMRIPLNNLLKILPLSIKKEFLPLIAAIFNEGRLGMMGYQRKYVDWGRRYERDWVGRKAKSYT